MAGLLAEGAGAAVSADKDINSPSTAVRTGTARATNGKAKVEATGKNENKSNRQE